MAAARNFSFLVLAICLFAGCKVGPDYIRPAPLGTNTVPPSFSGPGSANQTEWKVAEPSAHLPRANWWQLFQDPALDGLEALANAHNQDLTAALARLEQARASVKVSRADLYPQLDVAPSYSRQRPSANQPVSGKAAMAPHTYNTFNLPFEAGWEIDLWGRVRRQVESSRARLNASADELESLKLSIQAEVAADYFSLRALDADYELVLRTVQAYQRSLELTTNRRKGGIASDLDVSEAETQLRGTEALLPPLRLQRARVLHALAALCGKPASGFQLDSNRADLPAGPAIPVAVPSELLERRPDIAAAEQRMAAANAQVGVAKTAFYPRIRLSGTAGLQSLDAATWFDWPSRFWSVGPSLELPLFTGGRNRAQLAIARSAYDETVAQYRQTVLNAFQEIEDQLAARHWQQAQLESERAALVSARRTLELATNRYKAGLVSFIEVAFAQSAALLRERSVVQVQGDQLLSSVALIRALGGGWTPTAPE